MALAHAFYYKRELGIVDMRYLREQVMFDLTVKAADPPTEKLVVRREIRSCHHLMTAKIQIVMRNLLGSLNGNVVDKMRALEHCSKPKSRQTFLYKESSEPEPPSMRYAQCNRKYEISDFCEDKRYDPFAPPFFRKFFDADSSFTESNTIKHQHPVRLIYEI